MRSLTKFLAPVAVLAALGACATANDAVDVTRFHLGQEAARGTVFVEPQVAENAGTLEFQTYAGAVANALQGAGFYLTENRSQAELIAAVDYAQTTREAAEQRSPVTVGVGGGTGGRNVGVGGGISFGLGGKKDNQIATNLLDVRLMRTSDETTIWEGRAMTETRVGAEGSSLAEVIPGLAVSLFRDYPGTSGETVTYRD